MSEKHITYIYKDQKLVTNCLSVTPLGNKHDVATHYTITVGDGPSTKARCHHIFSMLYMSYYHANQTKTPGSLTGCWVITVPPCISTALADLLLATIKKRCYDDADQPGELKKYFDDGQHATIIDALATEHEQQPVRRPWGDWVQYVKSYARVAHSDPTRGRFLYIDQQRRPQQHLDCVAAGMLFFAIENHGKGKILLAFEEKKKRWTDLGGKIEVDDKTPYEAAMREVSEELNGVLPPDCVVHSAIYDTRAKYLCYLVQVSRTWMPDTSVLGTTETHTGANREFRWIRDLNEVGSKLAIRLHRDVLEGLLEGQLSGDTSVVSENPCLIHEELPNVANLRL